MQIMPDQPNNIILLSIDALRADHLGCYGYERDTSPFIDKLARENICYKNAYSASSHTREAIPALLTGDFPDTALDDSYSLDSDTIARYLKNEGYATAGFHSNPYVSRAYGYDDGFDTFDDDLHLGKHKLIALAQRAIDKLRNRHYARGEEINNRSLDWIDSLDKDQSFFLWNHYMDPHGPYEPFEDYRSMFHDETVSDKRAQKLYKKAIKNPESILEGEKEVLVNLYDAEIRYTDYCLRSFFNEIEERGLLDDSLVILSADHGDLFGEHGYFEHPRYPYRKLIEVPLIIVEPTSSTDEISTPVSTIDILPTIFSNLGILEEDLPGSPILPSQSGESGLSRNVVFSQASTAVNGSIHRRFGAINESSWEMVEYDVSTEDILDQTFGPAGEVAEALQTYAADRLDMDTIDKVAEESTSQEVDNRLEALGYKE